MEIENKIREYSDLVYRIAYSMTKKKTDAEDIYQEVFIKFFKNIQKLKDKEHEKRWLIRVTINECNMLYRKNNIRNETELDENICEPCNDEYKTSILSYVKKLPIKKECQKHSFFLNKNIYFNGDQMLKYKIKILFIFIIMLCAFTYVDASQPKLLGKIIYIDPGHGGIDPGATYKDLKESNINLEISKKIKEELEKNGAIVYLTRNGDYDLSEINATNHKKSDLSNRAKLINESECELYISIHLNSDPSPTWNGTQIFYTNKNEKNKEIAEIIQKKINTKRKNKELKNMYLFDKLTKPGILIEVGFISNSNDRYKLTNKNFQEKISKNITEGIIEYLKY